MGLDGMRVGAGRRPPLLVGGLLLACFLLVCNWWSLSTENFELMQQIEELNAQLKISARRYDQCVILMENLEKHCKHLEEEVGANHVQLQELEEIKKLNDQQVEAATMCKIELESLNKVDLTRNATLQTLRLEKDTMSTQLDAKKEENQKLKEDLETAQAEIEKLKMTVDAQPKVKDERAEDVPLQVSQRLTRGQLAPVAESAVSISVPGQRGNKYHGIAILPRDPPGATPQTPRFSVTFLKAATSETTKADNSADGEVKEEEENAAEANASGLETRFNAPDDFNDPKPTGEQQ